MKEEELKRKHRSHKIIFKSKHNHEEQQTITREADNRVRQSRPCLWAFVSVGEAFLFLFKDLQVHHNSAKNVTN
jgi:hypothetical protein